MLKERKPIFMLLLIATSLILMLTLQIFWLKNVYKDEVEQFEKQTDMTFHRGMLRIQDSIFQKSIRPMSESQKEMVIAAKNDSFPQSHNQINLDSPKVTIYTKNYYYQKPHNPNSETDEESSYKNRKIRIQLHAKRDSMRGVFRAVIKNIQENSKQTNFIVQLENDSLPIDSLHQKFKVEFAAIHKNVPFKICSADNPHELIEKGKIQTTPCFAVTTQKFYVARFENIDSFVLMRILPNILFSLFQFFVTAGAFLLIFRHWRAEGKLAKMKTDLMSNITHELKTPIATISVALEALKRFDAIKQPQLVEDYLNISQSELNRLSLLVENVMRSALLEQKGISLQKMQFDFKDLAEKAIYSLQPLFEKYGAVVQFDCHGDDFSFRGDIVHLNNVIYNLLDNALKYGSENPEITLTLSASTAEISLSIKDNGMGIAAAEQKKIFDKFYRVQNGDVHDVKGYGLGLSYVLDIVKKHHGKIMLESQLGKGSNFVLLLPKNL